ncbi:MAG: sigma-54-dependent transcriptional regulator [Arenicella sp.]
MPQIDVLLIEDSSALAQAYIEFLRNEPITMAHVLDGDSAMEYIQKTPPRLIILDLMLPDMNGMHILQHIHQQQLPIDVVVASGHGSMDDVVQAMQQGAIDFLEKPFSANRLVTTVKNALERGQLQQIVGELATQQRREFHGFIGSSAPMQLVYQTIEQVASSNAPVFISGESGTGKEVCAQSIHECSEREEKPFIALNCAAIPRDLVESEIFGHVKGAFTGAVNERQGAAMQASGGTLFLDEIAEMDIDLQAKLLRFIQTKSFQKVGGSKLEKVDVRFVCATNRDAMKEVEQGRFREDLYYRLNVINIEMPPLRQRGGDVVEIANAFLQRFAADENKQFSGFDQSALKVLSTHHWPGNIRELQNTIRRIVVMYPGGEVTSIMLQLKAESGSAAGSIDRQASAPVDNHVSRGRSNGELLSQIRPLWEVEKEAIEQAIELCDDNIPKAAALLGVSPSTIYRKIQSWDKAG